MLSECLKSDSKTAMLWKTKVVPIITQHAKNLAEYEQFVESHNLDDMISKKSFFVFSLTRRENFLCLPQLCRG